MARKPLTEIGRIALRQSAIWISLFLLVVCFFGCSKSDRVSRPLVGTWQLSDLKKIVDKVGNPGNLPDDSLPSSKMNLIFRADGTLETNTEIGQIIRLKSGTWKVLSSKQDNKLLSVECELNSQTTVHEIEFLDVDTIRLTPPNLAGLTTKLTFRRTDAASSK